MSAVEVPAVLDLLAAWPGARWLQDSGTAYLVVNATHILGIGLLLGGILPLDLRLLGLLRAAPLNLLAPFLTRVAATGLALALCTGAWLFTVRPADYWANTAFQCKAALLALALLNVAWQHVSPALAEGIRNGMVPAPVRVRAATSFALWLGVLLAGRWIGFW